MKIFSAYQNISFQKKEISLLLMMRSIFCCASLFSYDNISFIDLRDQRYRSCNILSDFFMY